ncbi:MAG: pirin family protein [Steroidobacteraceae bacterium]
MSWQETAEPEATAGSCPAIEERIIPRVRDIGDFDVRRALPTARRMMVGPFIFWDQFGMEHFRPGAGMDVRPHPHIGLATVTYMFSGEILHRDSLGTVIPIRPGEMNLMSAGRGIVHSERTPPDVRAAGHDLYGIQSWVALPRNHEDSAPAFTHFGAGELPVLTGRGATLRLIIGEMEGRISPVQLPMETIYAELQLEAGASLPFDARYAERAIYTCDGEIDLGGERIGPGELLVLRAGQAVTIRAISAARLMLLGGEPADAPRHIWWNFVASDPALIEQAKVDWKEGRFAMVPGETESIPLPPR